MKTMTARLIMTRDVLVVHHNMTAAEVASFLTRNEISGAPVLDENEEVVGVVSLSDLARAVGDGSYASRTIEDPDFYMVGRVEDHDFRGWEDRLDPEDLEHLRIEGETASVADLMTPSVLTVAPDTTVPRIAEMMVRGHYHRVLVTNDGKLEGIVSSMDLLRLVAKMA